MDLISLTKTPSNRAAPAASKTGMSPTHGGGGPSSQGGGKKGRQANKKPSTRMTDEEFFIEKNQHSINALREQLEKTPPNKPPGVIPAKPPKNTIEANTEYIKKVMEYNQYESERYNEVFAEKILTRMANMQVANIVQGDVIQTAVRANIEVSKRTEILVEEGLEKMRALVEEYTNTVQTTLRMMIPKEGEPIAYCLEELAKNLKNNIESVALGLETKIENKLLDGFGHTKQLIRGLGSTRSKNLNQTPQQMIPTASWPTPEEAVMMSWRGNLGSSRQLDPQQAQKNDQLLQQQQQQQQGQRPQPQEQQPQQAQQPQSQQPQQPQQQQQSHQLDVPAWITISKLKLDHVRDDNGKLLRVERSHQNVAVRNKDHHSHFINRAKVPGSKEYRDYLKNEERKKRDAETNAEIEGRSIVVYNYKTPTPCDKLSEQVQFKNQVLEEINKNNLGSTGFELTPEEWTNTKIERIWSYGKKDYKGEIPLKFTFNNIEKKQQFLECAKKAGFLNKRTQIINYGKYGKMSAQDFKDKANKFHVRPSTTWEERQKFQIAKQNRDAYKKSDNFKIWKNKKEIKTQTTYTTTEDDVKAIFAAAEETAAAAADESGAGTGSGSTVEMEDLTDQTTENEPKDPISEPQSNNNNEEEDVEEEDNEEEDYKSSEEPDEPDESADDGEIGPPKSEETEDQDIKKRKFNKDQSDKQGRSPVAKMTKMSQEAQLLDKLQILENQKKQDEKNKINDNDNDEVTDETKEVINVTEDPKVPTFPPAAPSTTIADHLKQPNT